MEDILNLQHLSNLPSSTLQQVTALRQWATQNLPPSLLSKHWEEGTLPPHILPSFAQHLPFLLGFSLPKHYGGTDHDLYSACWITKSLAEIDASITTVFMVQYGLCGQSILDCGTEEQKQRLLPQICKLHSMGCFCLTEPQSGSDASDLKTVAKKVDGGFVISGKKRWIGNAVGAEVFVVWARNLDLPGAPVMGFIVQQSHQKQHSAIQATKITGKISMRILQNANVEFHNAFCPNENVMHQHVGFAKSVGTVLEHSRIFVAWLPVGITTSAVRETLEYAKTRKAFGAPLASNQLVQEKLVRMTAMTFSIHLLAERITQEYTQGRCSLPAIAMAKAYNSKVGREVVALAREIWSGNGIVLNYPMAAKFADMESVFTYEGTYDINALVCGRALTGGLSSLKSAMAVKNEVKSKLRETKKGKGSREMVLTRSKL